LSQQGVLRAAAGVQFDTGRIEKKGGGRDGTSVSAVRLFAMATNAHYFLEFAKQRG
jgi:hypothetical protein